MMQGTAKATFGAYRGKAAAILSVVVLFGFSATGALATGHHHSPPPPRPAKMMIQNFDASGSGTGLDTTTTCPTGTLTGTTCYALSGDLHGGPIGQATFTATLNVAPPASATTTVTSSTGTTNPAGESDTGATTLGATPNGSGGTCAPASGTMTISFGNRRNPNVIMLGFDGTRCDVGPTPTSPAVGPTVLTGSFYVLGGTGGKFGNLNGKSGLGEGGAGIGTLTIGGDDDGDVLATLSGILEFSM